jgi:hypothetical protein
VSKYVINTVLSSAAPVCSVPSDNFFLMSVSVFSSHVLNQTNKHLYHLNESRSSRLWLEPRKSTLSTLIRAADWRATHHTRRGDRKWHCLCVAWLQFNTVTVSYFRCHSAHVGERIVMNLGPEDRLPCEVTRWFYKKPQWQSMLLLSKKYFLCAPSQKLRKEIVSFVMSVRPHGTIQLPHDRFSLNLIFEYLKKISRIFQFFLNMTRIKGTLLEDLFKFMTVSCWIIF